jgi:FkbM family methyltransferase
LAGHPAPFFARLGTSDLLVLAEIHFLGEYDPLFAHSLGEVHTVVDLGANCGYSARLWLERFPATRVVAVEPDADNVALIRRNNSAAMAAGRLLVIPACVGGGGTVYFDRSREEWSYAASTEAVPGAEAISSRTLPDILSDAQVGGPVDLLKCDIEGSERELFANARSWINRTRHLLVELHPPYTPAEFLAVVAAADPEFVAEPFRSKGENAVYLLTRRPA